MLLKQNMPTTTGWHDQAMSSMTGTESEVLREMLYFQRLEILRAITGLSMTDAHWKPHPDANSLIGIVSHLAWVERL